MPLVMFASRPIESYLWMYQAVHKALEKEVHKEEVVIKVTRIEEIWASR